MLVSFNLKNVILCSANPARFSYLSSVDLFNILALTWILTSHCKMSLTPFSPSVTFHTTR